MERNESFQTFLEEHRVLRSKLREWTAAESQASSGSYGQCQHAVSVMRNLCAFVEHEIAHHFREEEICLYSLAKLRLPHLHGLVSELQDEHDLIRQLFGEFRRQLMDFNTTGQLGDLARLSHELIAYLRYHMDREEQHLHPHICKEFSEDDWLELRRLQMETEAV